MTQLGFYKLHKGNMPLWMVIETNREFSEIHQHQLSGQLNKLLNVTKNLRQWSNV